MSHKRLHPTDAKSKRPPTTQKGRPARRQDTRTSHHAAPPGAGPVRGGWWPAARLAAPLMALVPLAFADGDRRLALAAAAMLTWCAGVAIYAALRGWRSGGIYLYGAFALAYATLTAYLLVG